MKTFLAIIMTILTGLFGAYAWAYTSEECIGCHGEGGGESALQISMEEFTASVHGREEMSCQDCHTGVMNKKHETTEGSGAVQCQDCHDQENRHGLGTKTKNQPECHSCHSRHAILEKEAVTSQVHPTQLKETCRGCHPAECGERDYLSWLPSLRIASHPKQDFGRAYTKTNCIGCHQGMAAHGPVFSNEVNPNEVNGHEKDLTKGDLIKANLVDDQDCYRCHFAERGRAGLWGYMHPKADLSQPDIRAAGVLNLILMVLLVGGGFVFYVKRFFGNK